MNDLFEAYVAAELSRASRGTDLSVQSQGGRSYCRLRTGVQGKLCFQTKPDLLIKRGAEGGRCGGHEVEAFVTGNR